MKKPLSVLIVLCMLVSMLSLYIRADDWHPPDEFGNPTVVWQTYDNPYSINVFLSNYTEANVHNYNVSTPDSVVVDAMLKHFELNASAYSSNVSVMDSSYGKYMSINGSYFEKRTKELFGRSISASGLEGYQDGKIYAQSPNADATLHAFAAVDWISYEGNYLYKAKYKVLISDKDVSKYYSMSYYMIQESGNLSLFTEAGDGTVEFTYKGNADSYKDLSPFDYSLVFLDQTVANIPYSDANPFCSSTGAPLTQVASTAAAPETTAPAVQTTAATSAETTSAVPETTEGTSAEKADTSASSEETETAGDEEEKGSGRDYWAILAAIVALLVVIAALIIVIIVKKGQKNDNVNQ